jgi:hypothetical protein
MSFHTRCYSIKEIVRVRKRHSKGAVNGSELGVQRKGAENVQNKVISFINLTEPYK